MSGLDDLDTPSRQDETDSKREWVCPECGHRKPRHHSARKRPFCDPCDWQHAVLLEMRPEIDGEEVDLGR